MFPLLARLRGLAAALLLLLPLAAPAAAPHHHWHTLESPHFEIHFHEGLYPVALQAARSLEKAHEKLVPILGAEPPRKTQVVLQDDTDVANGSATASERPQIFLLAEPPDDLSELGDYDDYVYQLVAHEYVHVLHLGMVVGVPRWLNWVFGDIYIPNSTQPRFVTEGLATYHESLFSSAGRLRSSLFDMYLRADVLEDRILTLGQLTGGPGRWPWGTAWYLYGGKLIEYLSRTRGDEALARYGNEYGANLIPWALNVDLESAAGVSWIALYDEWTDWLRTHYAEQRAAIEAVGPAAEPALRTRTGERTMAPRWSRDGRWLYYVEASADRRPWLRRIDRETGVDEEVHDLGAGGEISPLPGGGVILSRPEIHRAYQYFGDLFLVDEDGERRLTRGLRASEVDVAPDGRSAVFVRRGGGRTRLARIALGDDEAEAETVYEPPRGRQVYTPRFAPDGRRVVFGQTRAGAGRDLFLLDLDAGEVVQLTDDEAIDLGPTFTPDGRQVIFSSDRSGVFDLYRLDRESGETVRLTSELTGAFQPDVSPDGRWIAWTTYSSRGFDVAAAPIETLAPRPSPPPPPSRPAKIAPSTGPIYPVRPYDPLESIGPQSWFPYLASDTDGQVAGVQIRGNDMVGLHGWSLAAGLGIASLEPQLSAGYSYRGWYPSLDLAGRTIYRSVAGFPAGTTERASGGGLSLTFPWGSTRRSQSFRIGYEATWLEPLTLDPDDAPEPGLAAELQFGFGFSSTERPAEAISSEDGIQLEFGARFGSAALGSDFSYAALDVSAGAFVRLPWADHHVLALLGRAGIGQGDLGRRRLFSLGGPTLRDPLLDLLYTGRFLGDSVLRGYEPGAFAGSHLVLATLEYRFPIWRADAGAWTLPLYAGQLSGAFFAEAGDAFDDAGTRGLHPAAGAELRWNVAVGALSGSVRLGYARGFDRERGGGDRIYLGLGAGY